MFEGAAVCGDVIAPLDEAVDAKFAQVSDDELLANTRSLVGATNQILAELLTHLAEVEKRGVHRERLCTSLYTYCVYELRFSEDAAYRRVSAARLVQRFPVLYDAIASGELHLTGLLMLGPHLTNQNIASVLPRAKHRTKKELAKLVRQLDPLPDVPSAIVPLGPEVALQSKPRRPTLAEYARSFNPVNHLLAGDRPRDWMSDTPFSVVEQVTDALPGAGDTPHENDGALPPAPARLEAREPLETLALLEGPQRYQVHFTAGQEYVDLVEQAQALLSHVSTVDLADLHLRAMRALVAQLEKRKYAVKRKAVTPESESDSDSESELLSESESESESVSGLTASASMASGLDPASASVFSSDSASVSDSASGAPASSDPRWHGRGRYIPAAIRRAVEARDGLRCGYLDAEGRRCAETHRLEFHHRLAFAFGGSHSLDNLCLRCRGHNLLAAEEDFGREAMQRALDLRSHESLGKQEADLAGLAAADCEQER